MTEYYAINGSAASLAPFSQQWIPIDTGMVDHAGDPIYSLKHTIALEFGESSVTCAQQWLNWASAPGSKTADVLQRWGIGYVTLSPVYTRITQPPAILSGYSGGFSISIIRAIPSL